ncbi:DUF1684 domain-containing protein [Fimbriimonas ginsengisoli]|uniref:DUF1684 domain-containing protein n=1 Tax=Fimbriimonas ginsengisoli Gsoil 348 TaxID=661478 RepID=A0A068NM66_FIMGI|nr:DUF1684 domain-containing protein [Fimbriimonas ginsengisoli]AIE84512.1 hypothetical protein OP10G_1144 [Fimbriimonas ginsengisoli Gsoil 348]
MILAIMPCLLALNAQVQTMDLAKWRAAYESELKGERGWLSVAGLFWLEEGETTVGSAPSNGVRLPPSAPRALGTFIRRGKKVSFRAASSTDVIIGGKQVAEADVKSDAEGGPDAIQVGDLVLTVIVRGKRVGIRMYDPHSKAHKEFRGLHWYPANPAYTIKAKFIAYDPPKTISITNVLGDTTPVPCPGYVTFTMDGKVCRLDAQDSGSGLFLNFQDATTGKETYGAGRFLDTEKPANGEVTIDFNRATNPPCAYTDFATCPLPPKGNRLPVPIRAGEKKFHK